MNIDAKTRIGLFTVAAAIPTMTALIVWAVRVEAKTDAAISVNDRQEKLIDEQMRMNVEIRERLIRIEANQNRRAHGN